MSIDAAIINQLNSNLDSKDFSEKIKLEIASVRKNIETSLTEDLLTQMTKDKLKDLGVSIYLPECPNGDEYCRRRGILVDNSDVMDKAYPKIAGEVPNGYFDKKGLIEVDSKGGTFYFETKKQVDLFNEYAVKLGEGMEYFAEALVKGRDEFIANIIKTKRFDRYKTQKKKDSTAQEVWDGFIRQLSNGKEYTGYKYIPENAKELMQYILDNYQELSKDDKIGPAVVDIKNIYDAIESEKKVKSYERVLKHVGK